ncbi:hypothetical protein V6N13_086393 [Hibiscus sabdariffa]
MQSRVVSKPKIEVIWNSVVVEAYGDRIMGELKVNNLLTGEVSDLQVAGLFFAIGHEPQASGLRPQPANKFLDGQLQLDSDGLCSHFSLIREDFAITLQLVHIGYAITYLMNHELHVLVNTKVK